jgi:hypothetical protein
MSAAAERVIQAALANANGHEEAREIIADMFGISFSNVGLIARGAAWKHLLFPLECF